MPASLKLWLVKVNPTAKVAWWPWLFKIYNNWTNTFMIPIWEGDTPPWVPPPFSRVAERTAIAANGNKTLICSWLSHDFKKFLFHHDPIIFFTLETLYIKKKKKKSFNILFTTGLVFTVAISKKVPNILYCNCFISH